MREESDVASSTDDRKLAELVVGVLSEGRIAWSVGRLVVCVEAQRQAGRLTAEEASELVEFVAQLLPSAHRKPALRPSSESQDAVPQAQLPRTDERQVQQRDAVDLYYCTIQVANQATLRRIVATEGPITHECPTAPFSVSIAHAASIRRKSEKCPCSNPNCWVYQYTQPDNTPTEHKGA